MTVGKKIIGAVIGVCFFLFLVVLASPRPVLTVQVAEPDSAFALEAFAEQFEGTLPLFNFSLPREVELKLFPSGVKNPASTSTKVCISSLKKKLPYRMPEKIESYTLAGPWTVEDCESKRCICGSDGSASVISWKLFEEGTISLAAAANPESGILRGEWEGRPFERDLYSEKRRMIFPDFHLYDERPAFSNVLPIFYSGVKIHPKDGIAKLQRIEVTRGKYIVFAQDFTGNEFSSSVVRRLPDLDPLTAVTQIAASGMGSWWFWCGVLIFATAAILFTEYLTGPSVVGRTGLAHPLAAACALATFVCAAAYLALHLYAVGSWDAFNYAELVRVALNGGTLYRDIWQDKPPLAPMLFLPASLMRMPWGMNIEFIGVLLLNSFLALRLLQRRGFSEFTAVLGAASYFWGAFFMLYEGEFLGLEHLCNILLFAALICTSNPDRIRNWFFAGAAIAALTLIRQNNVLFAGWIGAPLLLRRNWRMIPAFIAGGGVTAIAVMLAALPVIDLKSFYFVMVEYPRIYAKIGSDVTLSGLSELVLHFLVHIVPMLCLLPIAIAGNLLARKRGNRPRVPAVFMAIGFVLTLLVVIAPQKYYQHYSVYWLPYLALVIALTVEPLVPLLKTRLPAQPFLLGAAFTWFVTTKIGTMLIDPSTFYEQRNRQLVNQFRELIEPLAKPGDKMYVFGGRAAQINQNVLYNAAGLSPGYTVSNYCELSGPFFQALPEKYRNYWEALERNKPEFLVMGFAQYEEWCELNPEMRSRVEKYFRSNYDAIGNIDGFIVGKKRAGA